MIEALSSLIPSSQPGSLVAKPGSRVLGLVLLTIAHVGVAREPEESKRSWELKPEAVSALYIMVGFSAIMLFGHWMAGKKSRCVPTRTYRY